MYVLTAITLNDALLVTPPAASTTSSTRALLKGSSSCREGSRKRLAVPPLKYSVNPNNNNNNPTPKRPHPPKVPKEERKSPQRRGRQRTKGQQRTNILDSMGNLFHEFFPESSDFFKSKKLPQMPQVQVPTMENFSHMLQDAPDNILASFISSMKKKLQNNNNNNQTMTNEFDAPLAKDIEDALQMANDLAASRGLGSMTLNISEQQQQQQQQNQQRGRRSGNSSFGGDSRSRNNGGGGGSTTNTIPRSIDDNSIREKQMHLFRENNNAIRQTGNGGAADRRSSAEQNPNPPSMFRQNNFANGGMTRPREAARPNSPIGPNNENVAPRREIQKQQQQSPLSSQSSLFQQNNNFTTNPLLRKNERRMVNVPGNSAESYANTADVKQPLQNERGRKQQQQQPQSIGGNSGGEEDNNNFWNVKKIKTRQQQQQQQQRRQQPQPSPSMGKRNSGPQDREDEGSFWNVKKTNKRFVNEANANAQQRDREDAMFDRIGANNTAQQQRRNDTRYDSRMVDSSSRSYNHPRGGRRKEDGYNDTTYYQENRRDDVNAATAAAQAAWEEASSSSSFSPLNDYEDRFDRSPMPPRPPGEEEEPRPRSSTIPDFDREEDYFYDGYDRYMDDMVGDDYDDEPSPRRSRKKFIVTDSALDLAQSLKLDIYNIFQYKQDINNRNDEDYDDDPTVNEDDVREYLDGRYESLFTKFSSSMPPMRRRGVPRPPGQIPPMDIFDEGGRQRSEYDSDFVAEEDWEAYYDDHMEDEDDSYGWNRSQFPRRRRSPYAAKPEPPRRLSQQQKAQRQQRGDTFPRDRDDHINPPSTRSSGRYDDVYSGIRDFHRGAGRQMRAPETNCMQRQQRSSYSAEDDDEWSPFDEYMPDGCDLPPPPTMPQRTLLPPVASVPLSELVANNPRLQQTRALPSDPQQESLDLSQYRQTTQAEFRETYRGPTPQYRQPTTTTATVPIPSGIENDGMKQGMSFQQVSQSKFREPYQGQRGSGNRPFPEEVGEDEFQDNEDIPRP